MELKYYDVPHSSFDLYGVLYEENRGFVRLPSTVAQSVSEGVVKFGKHTSGGRLRFSTNSSTFELTVKYDELGFMPHMALLGTSGFMLLEEEDNDEYSLAAMFTPHYVDDRGYTIRKPLKGGRMRDYILFFPTYNNVTALTLGFDKEACVMNGRRYREVKPILYYGSSVTQGACCSRPDNCYPAIISKWNHIDFINLGFSESGKAEDRMVDYLASLECSVFVCDYDYNAPDLEHLKKTHYRLYERYRAKNPDVPILFVSRANVDCEREKCAERFAIIWQTYERAKAQGDERVFLIDGSKTYGEKDRDFCTTDMVHPNDIGFFRYAKTVYEKLVSIDKVFE